MAYRTTRLQALYIHYTPIFIIKFKTAILEKRQNYRIQFIDRQPITPQNRNDF